MCETKSEKQFILEFIDMYRGLPALWNVKCKDYSNRDKKAEQYEVLIEKYRERHPNADRKEVVKKINSLRTNFRKQVKRVRDAEKSGVETKEDESLMWYFEEMKFLLGLPQKTPTISNSTVDISWDVKEISEDGEDDYENRVNTIPVDDPPCRNNRKRKATDPTEELVKLTPQRYLHEPQDDIDKIAAAWAAELRKMDPQQQLFAKKAINDIIFEGQMGTLHRNSVEINVSRV
ncbi:uncharacterized protein LOC111058586 [Nilaparvata lugens]|uniref:uncharacterized protein LOC111058586 n=1 Tax=Nilaparvata lugens TaxID=108931 RepID=UPI00193E3D14|nr:uncharacterized protein LOC111058586 [Nilaparvata lugens]XP_039287582.1 uncharacterized protein LOC111058586 [Nilaparvata lugens]